MLNIFWKLLGPILNKFSQSLFRVFTKYVLSLKGIVIDGSPLWISPQTYFDTSGEAKIFLGDRCVISHGVKILTHDFSLDRHYERVQGITKNELYRKDDVHIGKQCFIGMGCIILPGVSIGDGAIVAAGSIVTKNVENDSVVAGNPARRLCTSDELWARSGHKYFKKSRRR